MLPASIARSMFPRFDPCGIVVLSNLSGHLVRGVRWNCEGRSGLVARMGISDYQFIDLRTSSRGNPD